MKKIVYILLITFSFLHSVEIDEHKVDLYYANGIMMQDTKSQAQIKWSIRVGDLLSSNPELLNRIGKVDVAYNISKGMAEDLFEAFIQKTNLEPGFSLSWSLFKYFIGKIPRVGEALGHLTRAAEYATQTIHDGTLNTQITNYKESIKSGHGVVVVAHSQGNLFTEEAYRDLVTKDEWMGNYFHVISVATPGSEIPNGGHGVIFDNDFITLVPGGMKSNIITNTNRHDEYIYNALDEVIETDRDLKSISYHGFEYYMGYSVWEKMIDTRPGASADAVRSTKVITSKAQTLIMGWVVDEIFSHQSKQSQWKIKRNLACICTEKAIEVTHKYNPPLMDIRLNYEKIKDFSSATGGNSKIYSLLSKGEEQYVKASFGGVNIEEVENSETCLILRDSEAIQLGIVRGVRNVPDPKPGMVEVSLNWSNPSLDYDLIVEWEAGEMDIKDTGCAFEHFHILSDRDIYPGRYKISVVPKDGYDSIWEEESSYPHDFTLSITTPGASWELTASVLSRQSIYGFGHMADVNIERIEESDSSEDGGSSTSAPKWVISPGVTLNCPSKDVVITPSEEKAKAIYISSGGGSWSFSSDSSSSGGGTPSTGSTSIHSPQQNNNCGGDIDCYSSPSDGSNGSGEENSGIPISAPALAVGGIPVRDITQEETCTGDYSCHCIPCEYEIIPFMQQIYFGPLRDANFSIYTLDGYIAKESLFDGTTTNGETLYDAGELDVPNIIVNALEDDKLYIIVAQGGEDIDTNDDFVVDAVATKNLGKVYAMARGKDIKYSGMKINILTTVTFELLKQSIEEGATEIELANNINQIASRLLKYKIYPNVSESNITNIDLLAWLPTIDQGLLLQNYEPLKNMVKDIYAGKDIYAQAYQYVFHKTLEDNSSRGDLPFDEEVLAEDEAPIIKVFVGNIEEDAEEKTLVGKIEVLRGSSDISFAQLTGKGHESFTVNAEGEIRLADGIILDYEKKWLYKLEVQAINKNGDSASVGVYISVKNILDAPEYLSFVGGVVDENSTGGTIVGQITFNEGSSPITEIVMNGSSKDLFTIDIHGTILLAQGQSLDYEEKYSYGYAIIARNDSGDSLPITLYIRVKDIPDSPKVTGYTGGYIHEDAEVGTYVGQVLYDKGASDIESIFLEGVGSEYFSIDNEGKIYLVVGGVLDYETYTLYQPTVTVTNAEGVATKKIFMAIVNTIDVPTFSSFVGGNVKENSSIGTVVAQINFDDGSTPIESMTLIGVGSEYFSISSSGTIFVEKERLNYEEKVHYSLEVIASNSLGASLPVGVNLLVDDVAEISGLIEDFVINDIEENLAIGTVIGKLKILNVGSSTGL